MEAGADHKARNGALLFGAASFVTLLGLVLPHQAEGDTPGLVAVVAGTAALAVLLVAVGDRLPGAPGARTPSSAPPASRPSSAPGGTAIQMLSRRPASGR